jgi:hypothetical protein
MFAKTRPNIRIEPRWHDTYRPKGTRNMSWHPTERELDLAKRLDALEAQAARPVVSGGGLLSQIVTGVVSRVPPRLVTTALVVFLAWHGWDYFNRWQQLSAETQKLEAKAAALAADADAKGLSLDGETLQTQKMRTEIATLQADIARTQAEADKARAEADAQNQQIGKVKIAVLQKQAEVSEAEATATEQIQSAKTLMRQYKTVRPLMNSELVKLYEQFFYGGKLGTMLNEGK